MGLMDAVKSVAGGVVGAADKATGGLASKAVGAVSGIFGGDAKQQIASNAPASVGNALNGSGGKVMMAVPVKDVETISKIIATA